MIYLNTESNNNFYKNLPIIPFSNKENEGESTALPSPLETSQTTDSLPITPKDNSLWKTTLKVGTVTVGVLATIAGGYYLWKSLTSGEGAASIATNLLSQSNQTNYQDLYPNNVPVLQLIPKDPLSYFSDKIAENFANILDETVDLTQELIVETITPAIKASTVASYVSQNSIWLLGLGVTGLGLVLGLSGVDSSKGNFNPPDLKLKQIKIKPMPHIKNSAEKMNSAKNSSDLNNKSNYLVDQQSNLKNSIEESVNLNNHPQPPTSSQFKNLLMNDVLGAIKLAITCLSKEDEESKSIVFQMLDYLRNTNAQNIFLFGKAYLESNASEKAQFISKIFVLLLDKCPQHAYYFAVECLKQDTKETLNVVEQAFPRLLKNNPNLAYNFALECIKLDTDESQRIVRNALIQFLFRGQEFYALEFAKACLSGKNSACEAVNESAYEQLFENEPITALELVKTYFLNFEIHKKYINNALAFMQKQDLEIFTEFLQDLLQSLAKQYPNTYESHEDWLHESIMEFGEDFYIEVIEDCAKKENTVLKNFVLSAEKFLKKNNQTLCIYKSIKIYFEKYGEMGKKKYQDFLNSILEENLEALPNFLNVFLHDLKEENIASVQDSLEVHFEFLMEDESFESGFNFLKNCLNLEISKDLFENSFFESLQSDDNVVFLAECEKQNNTQIDELVILGFKNLCDKDKKLAHLLQEKYRGDDQKNSKKYSQEFYSILKPYYVKKLQKQFIKKPEKTLRILNNEIKNQSDKNLLDQVNAFFKKLLNDKGNAANLLNCCVKFNKKLINNLLIENLKALVSTNQIDPQMLITYREFIKEKTDCLSQEIAKLLPSQMGEKNFASIGLQDNQNGGESKVILFNFH